MSDQYFEEEEFTSKITGGTLLRILSQVKPYWPWVVGFLVAACMVSGVDAYFTFLGKRIVDEGILGNNRQVLFQILGTYASLIVVQSAFVFCFIYLAGILAERVRYDLRRKIFNHIQDLSLSYFSRTPVGWIMSRVTSDTDRIAELITWGLLDSTWAVFSILSAAYFMITINPRLASIVLLIIPFLIYIAVQFRKRILGEFRNVRRVNSKITAAYNENITGVRVVKALGREAVNAQEFSGLTGEMYRSSYRAAWLSALFLPVVQLVAALAIGAVVAYSGVQLNVGALTIGGIQAFIAYITFMLWPVQDMARVYAEMQHAVASAERMFSLMDAVPEIKDRPDAEAIPSLMGEIEFDHVEFFYESGKPVLQDFSLRVRPGETIALVGPTGGGKSTIVNLLCRFYEPQSGVVRIAGRDYTQLTLHSIQSRIGIVLQTPHMFSGTIADNIRYGRLEATDQEIEESARLAGAHDFILTLEKGYATQVGESGNLLSTGQKQLISLARAVLARPEIFIMDEATSSVDTLTEALIQRGMEHLMQRRTSFIIAHRLSTIKRADRIVVIENGRITEVGSHQELLNARGHYYRLYTRQFRREMSAEYDLFRLTGVTAD